MSDKSDIITKRRHHASTGNDPVLLALGDQIRTSRLSSMTQEKLALVSGVGRELVIQLENDKPGVALGNACRVLAALGLQLTALEH